VIKNGSRACQACGGDLAEDRQAFSVCENEQILSDGKAVGQLFPDCATVGQQLSSKASSVRLQIIMLTNISQAAAKNSSSSR